jgi:lysophospholipase L1-like esterase
MESLAAFSIIVVVGTMTPLSQPAAAAAETPLTVAPVVTWTTDERFGVDRDGDGRLDLPNTKEYVYNRVTPCAGTCPPPLFPIHLDAGLSSAAGVELGPLPIVRYRWIISGSGLDGPLDYTRTGPHLDVSLAEGDYQVDLRLLVRLPWGSITTRTRQDLTVDDLLVVAIGDSYASGEGNPETRRDGDRPAAWAEGGSPAADAQNSAAHRSTVAWPARVALALERADPHTSVTFVSMASTGARIDAGLIAAQAAELPEAQLDGVRRLVGTRPIDLMLIQVGGNDIGFPRIVRGLVEADPLFDPVCHDQLVANVLASARDGAWTRGVGLTFRLPFHIGCREMPIAGPVYPGLDGLKAAFDRLATRLGRLPIDRTVVVGYPDPTGSDADGTPCREIVGDTTPPFRFHEIDQQEQTAGVEQILRPLNAILEGIAADHGWDFVGGIDAMFAAGHGYCAPWPDYGVFPAAGGGLLESPDAWYRNPGRFSAGALLNGAEVTWYRTAAQSATLQGPAAPYATSGTLHPNEIGHEAIARRVLEALQAPGD